MKINQLNLNINKLESRGLRSVSCFKTEIELDQISKSSKLIKNLFLTTTTLT